MYLFSCKTFREKVEHYLIQVCKYGGDLRWPAVASQMDQECQVSKPGRHLYLAYTITFFFFSFSSTHGNSCLHPVAGFEDLQLFYNARRDAIWVCSFLHHLDLYLRPVYHNHSLEKYYFTYHLNLYILLTFRSSTHRPVLATVQWHPGPG